MFGFLFNFWCSLFLGSNWQQEALIEHKPIVWGVWHSLTKCEQSCKAAQMMKKNPVSWWLKHSWNIPTFLNNCSLYHLQLILKIRLKLKFQNIPTSYPFFFLYHFQTVLKISSISVKFSRSSLLTGTYHPPQNVKKKRILYPDGDLEHSLNFMNDF